MRYPRGHRGLAVALAAASALAWLAGCASQKPSPAGLAYDPPQFIRAEAFAAAESAGSVHVAMTGWSGPISTVYSADVSASAGRQVITVTGGGQATVLDVAGVGYVDGNRLALVRLFGFPAAEASRLAGRWVSFRSGNPGYQSVVAAATLGSAVNSLAMSGRLTSTGPRRVGGQPVVGVRGTATPSTSGLPATKAMLYVATTGRLLPVSYQEAGGNTRLSVVFSRWGETVSVTAPRDAVPITSVTPGPG